MRPTLKTPRLLALALTLGCGELDPESECKLGEFRCGGESAQTCIVGAGSKTTIVKSNTWHGEDCAKTGLLCVVGDKSVGCAAEKAPCDPKTFAFRCDSNAAIVCRGLPTDTATPTKRFAIKKDCLDLTCKVGKLDADCADSQAKPCDQGAESCDANRRVVCSPTTGLTTFETCSDATRECVALGKTAHCVESATPCTPVGAKKCGKGSVVLQCSTPSASHAEAVWVRKESCPPKVCETQGGGAACQ